jgi:hypothetical protein
MLSAVAAQQFVNHFLKAKQMPINNKEDIKCRIKKPKYNLKNAHSETTGQDNIEIPDFSFSSTQAKELEINNSNNRKTEFANELEKLKRKVSNINIKALLVN